MANIKMTDIAKAANVSVATVGRVIHNNGYVAEDKKKEIEQIIKDMGYVPNKMAQALKCSHTKLIGHMILFSKNLLYEQISAAVDKAALSNGYHVMTLVTHRSQGEEAKQIDELIGQRVEGIIITSNDTIDKELIKKLVDYKIPVVMIERAFDIPCVDRILVDDLEGSYEAVIQLLKNGHRKVGFIGKHSEHEVEINRYNGYCKAVKDYGIQLFPQFIQLKPDYSILSGYEATKELMEQRNPPTAIFMTSDTFACGAMQCLYEKNIRVPDEVSVIGYDNTLSAMLAPAINSVGLPYREIGEGALKLLLSRMENKKAPVQTILIHAEYIDRKTVLKCNK